MTDQRSEIDEAEANLRHGLTVSFVAGVLLFAFVIVIWAVT